MEYRGKWEVRMLMCRPFVVLHALVPFGSYSAKLMFIYGTSTPVAVLWYCTMAPFFDEENHPVNLAVHLCVNLYHLLLQLTTYFSTLSPSSFCYRIENMRERIRAAAAGLLKRNLSTRYTAMLRLHSTSRCNPKEYLYRFRRMVFC